MTDFKAGSVPQFEPLLNDEQAAQLLGIHPKTLQRLARTGLIPAHRVGRFWRYRASEIDDWLRRSPGSLSADRMTTANVLA